MISQGPCERLMLLNGLVGCFGNGVMGLDSSHALFDGQVCFSLFSTCHEMAQHEGPSPRDFPVSRAVYNNSPLHKPLRFGHSVTSQTAVSLRASEPGVELRYI